MLIIYVIVIIDGKNKKLREKIRYGDNRDVDINKIKSSVLYKVLFFCPTFII